MEEVEEVWYLFEFSPPQQAPPPVCLLYSVLITPPAISGGAAADKLISALNCSPPFLNFLIPSFDIDFSPNSMCKHMNQS